MDLLCISDLHGRLDVLDAIREPAEDVDILVLSGDITNFGKRKTAEAVVDRFLKLNDNFLAVPGNCDTLEVNDVLEEMGVNLHGKGLLRQGIAFFGAGGSTITPFSTPQEYREERLKDILIKGYEKIKAHPIKVMVCHTPPWGTKVDLTRSGLHVGSKMVRSFLEENTVSLVLCGHIHEAKGEDVLGDARIVNPGPGHMGYAKISIDENGKVKVELVNLH